MIQFIIIDIYMKSFSERKKLQEALNKLIDFELPIKIPTQRLILNKKNQLEIEKKEIK